MQRFLLYFKSHVSVVALGLIVVGFILHLTNIPFSPVHWFDEVQINEIARGGIGVKDTDWGVCLSSIDSEYNKQSWAFYWIGGFCSEIGYKLFGHVGPRVVSLTFLLLATFAIWFYIRKKTLSNQLAVLAALLFFSNPSITSSVLGGRFDILAIGLVFGALSMLQLKLDTPRKQKVVFAMVGFTCVMAVFSWITIVMTLPLVLWEMIEGIKERKDEHIAVWGMFASMVIVELVSLLILLSPFYVNLPRTLHIFLNVASVVTGNTEGVFNWRGFIRCLFVMPYILPFGIIVIFLCKRFWLLALAIMVFSYTCMRTRCYGARFYYYIPYAFVAIFILTGAAGKRLKHVLVTLLFCMVVFSYGLSFVARDISEYFTKPYRDYGKVKQECEKEIGQNVALVNDSMELYFIGRELGWRQLNSTFDISGVDERLLAAVDIYICDAKYDIRGNTADRLERAGYKFDKVICIPKEPPANSIAAFLKKHGRLSPLGPYRIFRKSKDG